jgi:hypothetical protein
LDLQREAVQFLADDFLPAGTRLARWARRFDARLSMDDIFQACRNAWTACGLQPLLGERVGITSSILGYSLLYPYSDNYLDRADNQPRRSSASVSDSGIDCVARGSLPRMIVRLHYGRWSR